MSSISQRDVRPWRADLLRLIGGFQASQAIHVAVVLGIADRLGRGPASVVEIARTTRANAAALARLMRVLVALGLIEETEGDQFALTMMGTLLQSDVCGTCAQSHN